MISNSDDPDKKEQQQQESSLRTPLLGAEQAGQQQQQQQHMFVSVDEEASPPSGGADDDCYSTANNNNATDPLLVVVQQPNEDEEEEGGAAADEETTTTALMIRPLRGQPQPPAFRDAWWAVLFYIQALMVLATAIMLGPLMMREKSSSPSSKHHIENLYAYDLDNVNNNSSNMYLLRFDKLLALLLQLLTLPLIAAMLSILAVYALLERYSYPFVQASFWMTPVVFTLLAIINTLGSSSDVDHHYSSSNNNNQKIQIMGLWAVAFMWTVLAICHYMAYRRSIPYTAANLKVALRALQSSRGGLLCCAVTTQIVLLLWWCVSLVALGGIWAYYQQTLVPCDNGNDSTPANDNPDELCPSKPGVWVYILWGLSLLWTQSVLENVLRTTTAGVVGSWWFPLGEDMPPGSDVRDSLYRSLTYSFGSICLGSLLVAMVQLLEAITRFARRRREVHSSRHGDGGGGDIMLCILECILNVFGRVLDYLNAWAFCYVGLYGYDYMTAGKNVQTLFRARGWSSIVSDRLVYRVLTYAKWIIAALTGLLVVMMDMVLDLYPIFLVKGVRDDGSPDGSEVLRPIFFGAGMLAGLFFADVSFRVAEGAVRTILVCFAESPADAALWHPIEFACLRYGWMDSYPEEWPHVAAFMFAQSNDGLPEASSP